MLGMFPDSQMCNFPSDNFPTSAQPLLAAGLDPIADLRGLKGPNLTFEKWPIGL